MEFMYKGAHLRAPHLISNPQRWRCCFCALIAFIYSNKCRRFRNSSQCLKTRCAVTK